MPQRWCQLRHCRQLHHHGFWTQSSQSSHWQLAYLENLLVEPQFLLNWAITIEEHFVILFFCETTQRGRFLLDFSTWVLRTFPFGWDLTAFLVFDAQNYYFEIFMKNVCYILVLYLHELFKKRDREGDSNRHTDGPATIYSSNTHYSCGWVKSKPEVQNSTWLSHMGSRTQRPGSRPAVSQAAHLKKK